MQEADAASILQRTRTFLAWRQQQPALWQGNIRFLETDHPVLAFERSSATQQLFCYFNLGDQPLAIESQANLGAIDGHGFKGHLNKTTITLPPTTPSLADWARVDFVAVLGVG